MEATCKNCDVAIAPEFDYCPKCSQKTKLHRLSLHEVFHEALHYFTHADKGFFQLIRDLALKNGVVAREYIEGKRKKYFPPLNFILLIAAVHLFVSSFSDNHVNVDVVKENPWIATIKNPAEQAKWIGFFERREHGINFMEKHANLVTIASLPILSFFLWLFYKRGRYNYTEHLVGVMYMMGFYTLLVALLKSIPLLFALDEMYIYILCFPIQIIYFSIFYNNFMGRTKPVKAFFASFVAILILFLISILLMWIYMFYMS